MQLRRGNGPFAQLCEHPWLSVMKKKKKMKIIWLRCQPIYMYSTSYNMQFNTTLTIYTSIISF